MYTLRSGKPALTNNGEKETGEKENAKPAKKIARVKNPVVLPDLQDNTHDSGETPSKSPAEVAKSRKRTLKNISDSNVKPDHTEEVVQSKRKKIVKVAIFPFWLEPWTLNLKLNSPMSVSHSSVD